MTKSLSSQVGILAVGRIVAFAVMFFVPLVNVRSLSVEEYGYYRQFWLIFETVSPLLIMGFPRSLLYYLPRHESTQQKSIYVLQTIVYLAAMSAVAWGIYELMANVLGVGLGAVVRRFYWRLVAFTFFMMVSHYMDSLFVAEKLVVRQSVYHAVTSVALALLIIIVSWMTRDIEFLIAALVLFALVKFVFAIGYTMAAYRPRAAALSISSVREQLSYAIPLGLASVVFLLLTQTDKFIINRFIGREAFAVYVIGAFQVPIINVVRQSITNVTFPLMSQYQKEGRYSDMLGLWQRSTLKTAVLFFPVFVFLQLTAKPFITILFTETYADAAPVFAIYLFLFLRSTFEFTGIISAFRQNRYLLYVFSVAFVVNLALSMALLNVFGRLGVPVATVVVLWALTFVVASKTAKLLGQDYRRVLPWMGLIVRFAVALVAGVVPYFVSLRMDVDSIFELALLAILYFSVYFAITFAARLLTIADVKSLFGR